MKLNETQKRSLATVIQRLEQAPVVILKAQAGRHKHVITSRLVRPHGPAAVLCSRGGLEKIAEQYHASKIQVTTPQGAMEPPRAPQGEAHIWPVEQLQDQRAMRARSYGLVIVDVRDEQLQRAVKAGRNLLRPGGKMIVWHHGAALPGVTEIEG